MRALLLTALLAGCGGDYQLRIEFDPPELVDEAEGVTVWLVDECPLDADLDTPPAAPLETSAVRRGEKASPIGETNEGDYAVQALARNRQCSVVAAGCEPVKLRSGDEHTIVLTLSARSGSRCQGGEVCGAGMCLPEGTCAELGSVCSPELLCCAGTCAPETLTCVDLSGGR